MARSIRIIGAPLDLGQTLRGVEMGPGALRCAGLSHRLARLDFSVTDAGNIVMPVRDALPADDNRTVTTALAAACGALYAAGRDAVRDDAIPVFLGGDHSIAIGTVGGVTECGPSGVVWIDAHADFNTPLSTETGNIHGMALAALTGEGDPELVNVGRPGGKVAPSDVVLIGLRELDPGEQQRLKGSGLRVYTMRDIDELGIAAVMQEALVPLSRYGRLHVSLDMDALDPLVAPGVGTPSPGGLSYREAHLLMELLADTGRVSSLDIVEINPILDERNKTAIMATELAASLFGKRIL